MPNFGPEVRRSGWRLITICMSLTAFLSLARCVHFLFASKSQHEQRLSHRLLLTPWSSGSSTLNPAAIQTRRTNAQAQRELGNISTKLGST